MFLIDLIRTFPAAFFSHSDVQARLEQLLQLQLKVRWKEQFVIELAPVSVDIFSEGIPTSLQGEHLLVKHLPEVFKQH